MMGNMDTDVNGLEILTAEECLRMLKRRSFGRLGLSVEGLPTIMPVNFGLIEDQIIIRTRRGAKLATATRNTLVAFEVDQVNDSTGDGWSVIVRGIARELSEAEQRRVDQHRATPRRLSCDHSRLVAVSIDLISGRRTCSGKDSSRGGTCSSVAGFEGSIQGDV